MCNALEIDQRVLYYDLIYQTYSIQNDNYKASNKKSMVNGLSNQTQAALEQFYSKSLMQLETELVLADPLNSDLQPMLAVSEPGLDSLFKEDWSLRQFWYSLDCADRLASAIGHLLDQNNAPQRVAILSAPSLWKGLSDTMPEILERNEVYLLEFDERFGRIGASFFKYDYNFPRKLDPGLLENANTFDIVYADPPFLREDCISGVAETIKLLVKSKQSHVLVATAEECSDIVYRLLNLHKSDMVMEHNTLANPFGLFTSPHTLTTINKWLRDQH